MKRIRGTIGGMVVDLMIEDVPTPVQTTIPTIGGADVNHDWRKYPATDKQEEGLKKWGLRRPGMTKGDAGEIYADLQKRTQKKSELKLPNGSTIAFDNASNTARLEGINSNPEPLPWEQSAKRKRGRPRKK